MTARRWSTATASRRADPRLLRAQGRHLRQHPGGPGDRREDRQRADPRARIARGSARAHRRHQRRRSANRTCPSTPRTPACPSCWQPPSATSTSTSTSPPRRPANPTARACARCSAAYELRDPLRRLEEALGDPDLAAPASAAEVTLTARVREATSTSRRARRARRPSSRLLAREREAPDGELFAEGEPWRFAVAHDGEVLLGECDEQRGARRRAAASARSSPTTPRRSAWSRRGSCTTRCSAPTCSSPPGAATRSRSCARSAGSRATLEDPLAGDSLLLGALADWQREQIAERGLRARDGGDRAAAGAVLRDMELLGVRLNVARLGEITERVRAELAELEARSSSSPAPSS